MGEVAMSGEKMEIQPKNDGVGRWEKFLPRMVMRVLLVEAHDSTRQIITALLRKCNYKDSTNHEISVDNTIKQRRLNPAFSNEPTTKIYGFNSETWISPTVVETNMQAGADHGYELLWVILIGLIFTLIIQSLAVNLGVTTGKHLAELCKAEYPFFVKYCLWLLAELVVIAADIPEGMAFTFEVRIVHQY